MKRKIFIISLTVITIIILTLIIGFIALYTGAIPQEADQNDVLYEKLVDIHPTTGQVWGYSYGFIDPVNFFRLHLSKADFETSWIAKLPHSNSPIYNASAPLWWNPGKDSITYQGNGYNEYIYDAKRELLFVFCGF